MHPLSMAEFCANTDLSQIIDQSASSSSPVFHSPAQQYSFRVPSPPRIIVPPPVLNANGIPDLHLFQDASVDYESSGFSNADFLSTVTYGNFITANNMLEWKYEQRRTAQKILPFLYLGPMSAAKDQDFLQKEGITMVLAMRNTQSAHAKLLGSRAAHELGLEVITIDVAGNQELIAAFPRGIEAINTHLSKMYRIQRAHATNAIAITGGHGPPMPGKVLIFCETGNERSATMVAAYIMAMYAQDVQTTLQIVQAQRFCVAYDDPLRNLLLTYESILKAKRDIHQATVAQSHGNEQGRRVNESHIDGALRTTKPAKRTFDDAQEDDMDVDMDGFQGQMDAARFEKREGLAPFQG